VTRLTRRIGTLVAAITLTGAALLATTGAAAVAHPTTDFDLNGTYADAGNNLATIRNTGTVVIVDLAAPGRPDGHGVVVDHATIFVDFPDDRSYTGVLVAPGTIRWSNSTEWTKAKAVPDVSGLTVNGATQALAAAGFTPNWGGTVVNCDYAPGQVADQSPRAGTLVRPGSAVRFRTATRPTPPRVCE